MCPFTVWWLIWLKAYNTLPRHPVFSFLRIIGVPGWFLDLWQRHLGSFERFFVVRRAVGSAQLACTGFPEGCPLSCVAMAVTDLVWHLYQSSQVPRALHRGVGLSLTIWKLSAISFLICLRAQPPWSHSRCSAMDLELDLSCFYAWSSSPSGRRELKNKGFKISLSNRDLGGQVTYCKQLRNRVLLDRIDQTIPYFGKLRVSTLSTSIKIVNIKQVLWPRALHGCEAVQLGDQHIHKLRSQAMRALGWDRAGASPYVRMCLFHLDLDPGWYQLWRVTTMFRSQMRANHVLMDWWKNFGSEMRSTNTHGPFGKIAALLEELNMYIDGDFNLCFSERGKLSLLTGSDKAVKAVLARNYQCKVCTIVTKRKGFAGLDGFDAELTIFNDHSFTQAELEQLMIVRDGSFFTNNTKAKWDSSVASTCAWCQVHDTKLHRYTECSRYDDIRAKYQSLFACWPELPDCFKNGGLVPSNPYQELVWEALNLLPSQVDVFQFRPTGTTLHAFTDGTCQDPHLGAERLAAWAVVIADHGVVSCGPLSGMDQCVLRAEITAVISALMWVKCHIGSLHIWSDNQTVVDHFRDLQAGLVDVSGYEHPDLWKQVQELVSEATVELLIHKVFSHDTADACSTPLEDYCRRWNNSADFQAGIANLTRPGYFVDLWDRFCDYRAVWKQRVKWYTQFVGPNVGVARDCAQTEEADQDSTDSPDLPFFAAVDNTMQVASCLAGLDGEADLFTEVHSFHFQAVFHHLVDWLKEVDLSSATMRPVSFIELYVGFRLSREGRAPLVDGSGLVDRYSPVSFAVDFSYFKQVLGHVMKTIGLEGAVAYIYHFRSSTFSHSSQPFLWAGVRIWRCLSLARFPSLCEIAPLFQLRAYPSLGNHPSFRCVRIPCGPDGLLWLAIESKSPCVKDIL